MSTPKESVEGKPGPLSEESKEQKPRFKNLAEAHQYLEKKYGVKTVDRTKDLEGKAIVIMHHTIPDK